MLEQKDLEMIAEIVQQGVQNAVQEQIEPINKRLDSMDEKFNGIDKRLDSMDEKINSMDKRLDSMDEKINGIDKRLDSMDERIATVETMLENDIRHGIKIIAEGHADLSRKLSDVVETEGERELLEVRVNLLESEMKLIKAKINA